MGGYDESVKRIDEGWLRSGAGRITDADLQAVVTSRGAIAARCAPGGPLGRFATDVHGLLALVEQFVAGTYTAVERPQVAAVAFALLYVLERGDLIPDEIPRVGYLDDIAVLDVCLRLVGDDLRAFQTT